MRETDKNEQKTKNFRCLFWAVHLGNLMLMHSEKTTNSLLSLVWPNLEMNIDKTAGLPNQKMSLYHEQSSFSNT